MSVVDYTQQLLLYFLNQHEGEVPLWSPHREHLYIQYVKSPEEAAIDEAKDQPPKTNTLNSDTSNSLPDDENQDIIKVRFSTQPDGPFISW